MRILVNHVNANGGVSFRILGQVKETAAKIKRHALRETDMISLLPRWGRLKNITAIAFITQTSG